MKNKQNTYLLLIAVIAVWGLLIYRFITGLNPKAEEPIKQIALKPLSTNLDFKKDSFSIEANYRDPFLGKMPSSYRKNTSPKKTKQPKKDTKTVEEKKVPFPSVTYKGIISPKNRLDKRFILKINGKTHLFKEGETKEKITLLMGNEKEITLLHQEEQKKVLLN